MEEEKPGEWETWALIKMKGQCPDGPKACTPKRLDPVCRICFDLDKEKQEEVEP